MSQEGVDQLGVRPELVSGLSFVKLPIDRAWRHMILSNIQPIQSHLASSQPLPHNHPSLTTARGDADTESLPNSLSQNVKLPSARPAHLPACLPAAVPPPGCPAKIVAFVKTSPRAEVSMKGRTSNCRKHIHKHAHAHREVWKPSRLVPGQGFFAGEQLELGKGFCAEAGGARLLATLYICRQGPPLARSCLGCGPRGGGAGEGNGRREDAHRK